MANTLGRNQDFSSSFRRGARPPGGDATGRGRARREIVSPVDGTPSVVAPPGRRLSPEERRALQERRRSRTAPPPAPVVPPAPVAGPARAIASPELVVARKPAPRMPRSAPRQTGMPRGLVVLGAVLIAGLAILALAGGRLFGAAGGDPPAGENWVAAGGGPAASPAPATPAALPQLALVPPAVASPTAGSAFAGTRPPVVCLDPGHGGPDLGFQRVLTDAAPEMNESILVLQHAWDLEARLKLRGYEVVMTRRDDVAVNAGMRDVNGDGKTARDDRPNPDGQPGQNSFGTLDELQARINVCNDAGADLLVSMHVNGFSTSEPRGHETWFTQERPFGDRNYDFAARAYRQLSEQLSSIGYELPWPERGVLPDTTANVDNEHSMLDHFVMTGPDVPERKIVGSRMPGAIVETLFISSEYDAPVLASPAGRAAIVTAYENAIVGYFEDYPPEAR